MFQMDCEPDRSTSQAIPGSLGVLSTNLGSDEIAQTLTPANDMRINAVLLRLAPPATSSPLEGTLTLTIDSTINGMPAGQAIATGTHSVRSVTRPNLYEFRLSNSAHLSAKKQYWLRLNADYAPDPEKFISWQGSNANIYADGLAMYKIGSRFVTNQIGTSLDLIFQLRCDM